MELKYMVNALCGPIWAKDSFPLHITHRLVFFGVCVCLVPYLMITKLSSLDHPTWFLSNFADKTCRSLCLISLLIPKKINFFFSSELNGIISYRELFSYSMSDQESASRHLEECCPSFFS